MNEYTVTSEGFVPAFGLPEGVDEILQNVATIMSSRQGSMPMSRHIGLSHDWIGKPLNIARVQIVGELSNAIQEQEPRATLAEVMCAVDDKTGEILISAKVVIADGE